MKINNDLLTKAQQNLTTAQEPNPAGDQYAAKIMNELFKSLFAAKPGWRATFPGIKGQELDQAINLLKKTWIKTFSENGINTPEQLQMGMKKVRSDPNEFLPSPGQFVLWCKPQPEDLGLPSAEQAYKEACDHSHHVYRHKWTHPIVYQCGAEASWYSIRTCSSKAEIAANKKLFLQAYESLCKRVMAGEVFDVPAQSENAIEDMRGQQDNTKTEQSKAANIKAMSELKGLV